jgi:hypothetical protein
MRALVSLAVTSYESQGDSSTFADDVVVAMSQLEEGGAAIPKEEADRLKLRVLKLMECPGLRGTAKVIRLRTDFPNTLCSTKILTDLRPVFGADVGQVPSGAVITHTLKIKYHRGDSGRLRQFYVALDANDLESLTQVLMRARGKASTLQTLLQRTGVADCSTSGGGQV